MKFLLPLLLIFSEAVLAKTVLISGFDAFDGNKGNNSEIVAKNLEGKFKNSEINIKFCPLRTVYFKSSETLKDCLNEMPEKPDYIIGLGEGPCKGIKFERKAVNFMKDISSDNDGVHYEGEVIRVNGASKVDMSLNLTPLYKMLSRNDRKFVKLSNDQGTFVCNNLSYIMVNDILDTPYTFIHVPAFNCKGSDKLVERSTDILEKTIYNLFN